MATPLVEGRDYYIEEGRMVFTAYYLLQRGYCCASGCRHCPYGYTPPEPPRRNPTTPPLPPQSPKSPPS